MISRGISGAGSWIQLTAAGWFVLQQTGSAAAVGVLAAITFAPRVVGAPIGGWMADHHDIRKVGALLSVLRSISPLVIGVLIWDNDMPIGLLYALIFLGAIPGSLASPIMAMLPPLAVPKELASAAIADSAVVYNMSRVLGPLIGSGLITFISIGGAFIINGLSYLFDAWVIRRAVLVSLHPPKPKAQRTPYLKDVRRGLEHAITRTAFLGALAFFGLVAPIQQLLPSLAATHGQHVFQLGILLAAIAVGGFIANPFIRRAFEHGWSHGFLVNLAIIVCGPVLVLLGRSSLIGVDIALLVLLGAAWESLWVGARSTIQIQLPPDITGRMLGLFFSVVTLGIAVGSLLLGFLFQLIGARTSLTLVGCLVCIYGIVGMVRIRGHIRHANRGALPPGRLDQ